MGYLESKMDRVTQLELTVMARQKYMNEVIEDRSSPIQKFYEDKTIFITGGGGFLGKQLIEKLLRACDVKKIFILMRSKKGKTVQERLEIMIKDPAYDILRDQKPDFATYLEAVEGDVSELSLGLSTMDYSKLTREVNIIIHMAATIRFDGPLRDATMTNVRGTRECVALAKACQNLKCMTYVSTAFTHATKSRIGTEIKEAFYPTPIDPEKLIAMAEDKISTKIDEMTPKLIKDWPNTYTFTKAVAEEVIRLEADELPVCVVRPPVVLPAYYEPTPGWSDHSVMYGPSGIMIGVGLGVLHVFPVETDKILNMVPVDYVNNAIIAAGWDSCGRRDDDDSDDSDNDIPIYTVSSTKRGVVWDFLGSVMRSDDCRRIGTPLAVWYCYLLEVTNPILYWLLTWILHYIPAYLADGICTILRVKNKQIPSFRAIYQKVYKMSKLFCYFFNNNWYFDDENLTDMISRMSGEDRLIFNCDIYTIDYGQFVKVMVLGLRKYVVQDPLVDSELAYRKQKWFYFVNILFIFLYAYITFLILYLGYLGMKYIFN